MSDLQTIYLATCPKTPGSESHASTGMLLVRTGLDVWPITRFLDFTALAAGLVLLTAAAFKAHELLTVELTGEGLFAIRPFRVALIEVELICGLGLVMGSWQRFFRGFAQLLFAAFLAFSIYQAAFGAKTCSCLGRLEVAPAIMALLDSLLLLALKVSSRRQRINKSNACWPVAATLAILPIPLFASFSPEAMPVLEVSPRSIDLGGLRPGERKVFPIELHNPRNEGLTIERFEASCQCLEVEQRSIALNAGEQTTIELVMDLAKEPDFVGALAIQLNCWTKAGTKVLVARVQAHVTPN